MNRAIDARIHKIERALAPDNPDDEFGVDNLSEDDLNRVLHNCLLQIAANERGLFTQEEASDAREKLVSLECTIWATPLRWLKTGRPVVPRRFGGTRTIGKPSPRNGDYSTLPAISRRAVPS